MAIINLPPTTPKKPIDGAFYSLSGYGVYQEKYPPEAISDFSATDITFGSVACTWTVGADTDSVDIYRANVLLTANVTSPYTDVFTGTAEYFVMSNNVDGSTKSNVDSGTGT